MQITYLQGTAGWAQMAQRHPQTNQLPQAGWIQQEQVCSIHPGILPFQLPSQLQPVPPFQSVKIYIYIFFSLVIHAHCTQFPMEFWMFYLFRIPVEVQIWHDLPWVLPWDCSSHPENFPSQHPPHETNRMVTLQTNKPIRDALNMLVMTDINSWWSHLVITRNSNVHISQWGVGVAESNGGNVDIWCLSQWLMVSSGVSHNQKPWLPESCLDLIGECAWGEPTVEGCGTSGSSKFQNSSLQWHRSLHTWSYIWTLWMKCGSGHDQMPITGQSSSCITENRAQLL